jgi:hypothetical protein
MEKTVYVCNNCLKQTADYYNEIGWIHINREGLTVTYGQDDCNAKYIFVSDIKSRRIDSVDFLLS